MSDHFVVGRLVSSFPLEITFPAVLDTELNGLVWSEPLLVDHFSADQEHR
jgi:hypothetical protein